MAEELENVCMCVENGQPLQRVTGEWVVAADGLSFSGEVRSGLVAFTADQASSVRGKDEFDLTIYPKGYQTTDTKYPGSILDRPDKLPLPVAVRRLTPEQKVELIIRNSEKLKDNILRRFVRPPRV